MSEPRGSSPRAANTCRPTQTCRETQLGTLLDEGTRRHSAPVKADYADSMRTHAWIANARIHSPHRPADLLRRFAECMHSAASWPRGIETKRIAHKLLRSGLSCRSTSWIGKGRNALLDADENPRTGYPKRANSMRKRHDGAPILGPSHLRGPCATQRLMLASSASHATAFRTAYLAS